MVLVYDVGVASSNLVFVTTNPSLLWWIFLLYWIDLLNFYNLVDKQKVKLKNSVLMKPIYSEQLSMKEIETQVNWTIFKFFGVPMLLLIAFILVIAGMIMHNRYALPMNTILIVDSIAGIVLSACACYLVWFCKSEEKNVGNDCPIRNYFLIPMLFFIAFILVIIAMIMHNRYAIAWDTIVGVDAIVGIILTACVYIPVRSCENRWKAEYGC